MGEDNRPVPPWAREVPMPDPPVGRLDAPIKLPVAGPGMPRYEGGGLGIAWLIPAAVLVVTALAILCGALWR